ncbi:hypothetical protein dsmv_0715 [Desulfococcus multivorans DSM 2059]|uniref:Uncharacterized protein n=1 Tax=Desulfococcus multivorans DSM 2059 TaxID=1121405 RepID=S7THB4_DESML|nr:hypothetical protein dsmv_0715 [Desulfococcus multivorans DSM 2059]SJZ36779.1 hypothetical protein SAMN02745446_00233 [Desulfococcus multivorans DSM 2059]
MRRWRIWDNYQGINTFPSSKGEGIIVLTVRHGETRIYGFVFAEGI